MEVEAALREAGLAGSRRSARCRCTRALRTPARRRRGSAAGSQCPCRSQPCAHYTNRPVGLSRRSGARHRNDTPWAPVGSLTGTDPTRGSVVVVPVPATIRRGRGWLSFRCLGASATGIACAANRPAPAANSSHDDGEPAPARRCRAASPTPSRSSGSNVPASPAPDRPCCGCSSPTRPAHGGGDRPGGLRRPGASAVSQPGDARAASASCGTSHLGHGPGLYARAGLAELEHAVCESSGRHRSVPAGQLQAARDAISTLPPAPPRVLRTFPSSAGCEVCTEAGRPAGGTILLRARRHRPDRDRPDRAALARHPERFRERVYTPREVAECERKPRPAQSYAGRFAGKEAIGKALGTRRPVHVDRDRDRRPRQAARHPERMMAAAAERLGVVRVDLSMTHSKTTAAAVAIAVTE